MSPDEIQSERIEDVDVSKEMQDSFLEYAYSVIYSRALPDARDGLKPVQRRILFLMGEMGLRPDKGHVKSARVVGEVMGKLHPHGDSAIYDALVRLAQDWTMRVPLVDGHGNFGSLDDGPAASRYTEARLAESAMAMIQDLDEDVVNFVPNYDNQLQQPEVLPAAFPNLLVNGASGIAVGMATNMAPHNLGEVIAGARHLLDNPQASLEDLMNYIPGPDLPSGGKIVGLAGVRDAYATGRGSFKVRAKVSIENVGPRKTGLVVTELPYMVGPEKVIEKIKDGVNAKKITGISAVTDLTDRKNGLKLVITVKSGFDPEAILQELYRLTPLEDSFSINNVALVDGGPRTLGLRELLQVYVEHRLSVVTRRSQYRLMKRKERLHLVEGLLVAIIDIDEVIQLIRASDNTETARTRLQEVFDLSELQADYILELRLRRLTKFSRIELETERDALLAEIAHLEELLGSPALLRRQVSTELADVAAKHGTPRRTILAEANATIVTPKRGAPVILEIQDRFTHVFLSTTGHVVRVDEEESWLGTPGGPRSKDDAVRSRIGTSTRSQVGVLLANGRVLPLTVSDVPAVPPASVNLGAGILVTEYLELTPKDRVIGLCSFDSEVPLALATAQGVVKRVAVGEFQGGKPEYEAISLKAGDFVVGASHAADGTDLVLITDDAQLLRFDASAVRPQGRAAGGMAGIKLAPKASVIFFGVVDSSAPARVVTVAGLEGALPGTGSSLKVSDFAEYPAKGRATGGVRAHRFLKGESGLALAWAGPSSVRAVSLQGAPIDTGDQLGRRDGSGVPTEGSIASIGSAIHPDSPAAQ